MNDLRQIEPLQAQVDDYIIRFWDGKPGKLERIISIYAQGISVKGKSYVLGYSDYFGNAPKSSMSFKSCEEDEGKPYRTEIYAGF